MRKSALAAKCRMWHQAQQQQHHQQQRRARTSPFVAHCASRKSSTTSRFTLLLSTKSTSVHFVLCYLTLSTCSTLTLGPGIVDSEMNRGIDKSLLSLPVSTKTSSNAYDWQYANITDDENDDEIMGVANTSAWLSNVQAHGEGHSIPNDHRLGQHKHICPLCQTSINDQLTLEIHVESNFSQGQYLFGKLMKNN